MRYRRNMILLSLIVMMAVACRGQKPLSERKWTSVATEMLDEWYGSDESVRVAENVLLYQRTTGGWPKNTSFHLPLSHAEKAVIMNDKSRQDAIFDNGATTTEIRFLATMYNKTGNSAYKTAVENGLNFILEAQYENGGWPMYYPLRKGYYTHITYNDNAIYRMMKVLSDVYSREPQFSFVTDENLIARARDAWDRGVGCILKTQIIVNGKPTVWCAQHDEKTFLPAKARSYELPSFSGAESVGLLLLLMEVSAPTPEIIHAVNSGIEWLDKHRIKNMRLESFTNEEGKEDIRIIGDKEAGDLWARFYDLETGLPFFCDRDGIKRNSMDEIGYERRNNYNWYTDEPQKAFKAFAKWKAKHAKTIDKTNNHEN